MSDNNSKVFVGRLPDGCTEKDLEDLFRTYGTVNQTDLIGKYGFVHMTKREEAEEAIKKLNNYNFMGSQLTVQFSTSKMNGNTAKSKMGANRKVFKRNTGPYSRNNSYQSPQSLANNRFAGPPPVPPNNYMPYYDDMNGYYREPYYTDSDPYYPQNDRRNGPPYDVPPPPPLYGRRGPPPVVDYQRAPPAPIQPDYYSGGDGAYNRPVPYGPNRAIPPIEATPPPHRPIGFGASPMRNGYGGSNGFTNRGPTGSLVSSRPAIGPPPPNAHRWQPY